MVSLDFCVVSGGSLWLLVVSAGFHVVPRCFCVFSGGLRRDTLRDFGILTTVLGKSYSMYWIKASKKVIFIVERRGATEFQLDTNLKADSP